MSFIIAFGLITPKGDVVFELSRPEKNELNKGIFKLMMNLSIGLNGKVLPVNKKDDWYFVTIIVLTYCEKKLF